METIRIPRIVQDTAWGHLLHGRTIGFVPTMGALHEGHLSLVRMARDENDITAVSIYVNPLQFGPSEDLLKYPRDLEGDSEKLRGEGVDILFLPEELLMYPEGFETSVEVFGLSGKLCGAFRPGHFKGVATVVTKLFHILNPTRAYFGRKDFQQTLIIRRLVRDLNIGTQVVVCPTVREGNGLAMSSRNRYLSEEERRAAAIIYRSLEEGAGAVKSGIIECRRIRELMLGRLSSEPLISEIQYCSVFDPGTLDEPEQVRREALLAVAVKIGATRLIDNLLVAPGI